MNFLHNLLIAVQIISALVMIGLVLVQHGKGADMGASFGSGASGSLFGATGSANFLSRSTAVCATVFFVATLSLAFYANDRAAARPAGGSSVLEGSAAPAASVAASTPAPSGAALVPGAESAAPAASK
ncbi:preprotein translocase subunit SecG [Piscinibacter sp.]|uniref:preprotein translocase subunit SecG n=1 Tax=Piscinibacter sp. TaxID=1903157 RepID=UPI0039E2B877